MQRTDPDYMKIALELAEKGLGWTSPNPAVGAVIVKDGLIVGKGWHEQAGGAHAEVNAIADAAGNTRGSVMYVTLEPCNHHGNTPPCTESILKAGISRVVCAMKDPNPDVAGGGAAYLASRGIEVETGICENEARRLNESFIKFVTTGRPFVILKSAATLDGKIASKTGDSKWVTGPAARRHVHLLRHWTDAILVGINTVRADDPSLTSRLEDQRTRDPVRIILDSRLSISENARVLTQESCSQTVIAAGDKADSEKAARLEKKGVRVLRLAAPSSGVDLEALIKELSEMKITSLLVEGGSRVSAAFFAAGLVDKICFFYAPKILGGDGIPICSGPGPQLMGSAIPAKNIRIIRFDHDILVEGYIR
ncbi:MAG: bifunctional diaminohydroxyphosphoribosylaminopyrimidine deaminase/5-amino-6-(5-phosphoribosylamino)uracil reductase RibD [Desulfobacteraceae bacterium]|nr:bifunctional diaminohydroxyphosphoribosylaminopyrimidine deaminase/5-amino-6-(5-phosphoribosylamino)uracil reductase RibD [Desulfobacteraceae bacterium]MCF8095771.1 bifunctional diaminohydroxyphosphoribosylaminopyrimidine deaminase/5-amino-6-(5-phosphoribosylamino)uracil reductase RibD [Desulfobacteraceae bacterium]